MGPASLVMVTVLAATDPPPAGDRGAYVLGVDPLLRGDLAAAKARLSAGLAPLTPGEGGPSGTAVGHAASIEEAMAWVARSAFSNATSPPGGPVISEVPAPAPFGVLFGKNGAVVGALTVAGTTAEGEARAVRWPDDLAMPGAWPATLVPARAPLFAAPAPAVPPAGERLGIVLRHGALWIVGTVDRCEVCAGARSCLRWAQVIARDGPRFRAGYLPAAQVALRGAWVRGEGRLPRAQIIASAVRGGSAVLVLVARARDGQVHKTSLESPMAGDRFPEASLKVTGDWAIVSLAGGLPRRLPLDATLEQRTRDPPAPPAGPTP